MLRQYVRDALLAELSTISVRTGVFEAARNMTANPDLLDGDIHQVVEEEVKAIQDWFASKK